MKCSSCEENVCERKFTNQHKCVGEKEGIKCSCICQVSPVDDMAVSIASIGSGIAVVAGGVALTVMTGGMFAVVAGAAIVGAGSSLVLNSLQKKFTGERMTVKDSAQDVALGATIGGITGPIGAAGGVMAKSASGVGKFFVRMGAGAVAGSVGSTVSETARAMKGEQVSVSKFAKSITIGAIAGSFGGASTQIASNVSNNVANEVAKSATRVGVQVTSAAVKDAGLQLYEKGEVDVKQVLLTTVGQATLTTTCEVSQNETKRIEVHTKRVIRDVTNNFKDKERRNWDETKHKLVFDAGEASKLFASKINLKFVGTINDKILTLIFHKDNLIRINKNSALTQHQKTEIKGEYRKQNNLPKGGINKINKEIKVLNKQLNLYSVKTVECY